MIAGLCVVKCRSTGCAGVSGAAASGGLPAGALALLLEAGRGLLVLVVLEESSPSSRGICVTERRRPPASSVSFERMLLPVSKLRRRGAGVAERNASVPKPPMPAASPPPPWPRASARSVSSALWLDGESPLPTAAAFACGVSLSDVGASSCNKNPAAGIAEAEDCWNPEACANPSEAVADTDASRVLPMGADDSGAWPDPTCPPAVQSEKEASITSGPHRDGTHVMDPS